MKSILTGIFLCWALGGTFLWAQVALDTLYPRTEVIEYVESGTSGQYLLRLPGKPQIVLVYLNRFDGDLTFEVRKGKKKIWAQGALIPAGAGRWESRIDQIAPGLGHPLAFIMDRAVLVQALPSVSPISQRKPESPCRNACVDAFLQTLTEAEERLNILPPAKAVRNYGFTSEPFLAYQEVLKQAWSAYQQCKDACD